MLDILGLMLSGRPPCIKDNATSFMKKVVGRLAFFAHISINGTDLVGVQAIEASLKKLTDNGVQKSSIADCELVVVFKWLLKKDDQTAVGNMVNDILVHTRVHVGPGSAAASSSAVAGSSSSSGAVAVGAAKKGKAPKSEVDAALAMFG